MDFGASAKTRKVAERQAATSIGRRIIEERGPSKGKTKVMARGSLLAYFFTSGKSQDATTYSEDHAPSSVGLENKKIGRRSVAGYGTERC